jgi:hypothetical protein
MKNKIICLIVASLIVGACSSADTAPTSLSPAETTSSLVSTDSPNMESQKVSFTAEVWADNWFSLYINGELVGEDSVSITTEKSFNSEKISFEASYPFTIAMVTKDFKQNDSGLEYIGTDRQQIGDGGFIAQFTDTSTGKVVATTSSAWKGLVIHQAPLDTSCEKSANPDTECTSKISAEPSDWRTPSFNDVSWPTATTYTESEVGVKDGYNNISWSPTAKLIWTSNLKIDNTILWRHTVVQ